MKRKSLWIRARLAGALIIASSAGSLVYASQPNATKTTNVDGHWVATITHGGVDIPFRLDILRRGNNIVGKLYNGSQDYETTTSASVKDGIVELNFLHYLTSITAHLTDGGLDGQVTVSRRSPINITPGQSAAEKTVDTVSPFHAKRYVAPAAATTANVPNIDGVWEIPHESPKGEKAWRLIVKQKGAEITASILRVDGDTGALTGGWQDGKFVASHFDGARAALIEITPVNDGSLQIQLNAEPRKGSLIAYRPEIARAKGLPEPANYLTHTSVRDPNEVFTFNFPDVEGKLVSNADPKFKGKVVLAIVTGTWCPNCHDEAKYLVELYKQYHNKGVEIIALDFEEEDQLSSLTRVKAFIRQYQIPYTYVIAGTPDEMWEKVPQAVNLNTWPATIFIGRDGRVKAIHSGFASAASGVYNAELKDEFSSILGKLLKESPTRNASTRPHGSEVAAR